MGLRYSIYLFAVLFIAILQKDCFGAEENKQESELKGGVSVVYEAIKQNPTIGEMNSAINIIRKRLDKKNYIDAKVSDQGKKQIRVEIPRVSNSDKIISELGQTAQLKFVGPDGIVILTGADIKEVSKQYGQSNRYAPMEPYVCLEFNDKGKKAFAEATKKHVGKPIYILLDQEILSAPTVQQEIRDGNAMITGKWTEKEVDDLANLINSGSLPFEFKVISVTQLEDKKYNPIVESFIRFISTIYK